MKLQFHSRWLAVALSAFSSASFGVTFQFTAPISSVYGQHVEMISNIITAGMICNGTVSYDLEAASADGDPSTNNGIYFFAGTHLKISMTVGTNVFSSMDSSTKSITVTYQDQSPLSDGLSYNVNKALLNGQPFPGSTDSQFIYVEMSTTNLAVLTSDALPTVPPLVASYPIAGGSGGFRQISVYTYIAGNFGYGFLGDIASITPIPALSAQIVGNQFVVSWSTNAVGFQLQSTPNPEVAASWESVNVTPTNQSGIFQVGVPLDNSNNHFFRLSSTGIAATHR